MLPSSAITYIVLLTLALTSVQGRPFNGNNNGNNNGNGNIGDGNGNNNGNNNL
ncbi:14320_t:CDS:1, partial [Ambispora leptoticha]